MEPRALPSPMTMERAVYARDVALDGIFVVAVVTTSVFCRPSCPARKPLEKNMRFFATPREALLAGFRPCLRCRPMALPETPSWVGSLLARIDAEPEARIRDFDLRQMGIEPARARRYFQASYGMTFHAYARARRLGDALRRIRDGKPIDEVAIASGWESHSGFRDAFGRLFGAAPRAARAGTVVTTTLIESPLGTLVAGAVDEGLCLLEFTDRRMLERQFRIVRSRFRAPIVPGGHPHLEQTAREMARYFEGTLSTFTVPLAAPGTPFQESVWRAVAAIPAGRTRTYEQIAEEIGAPRAIRAVGTANGMNRIAILIPCHRVITKEGKPGGYGGGIWRKERLLELERSQRLNAER